MFPTSFEAKTIPEPNSGCLIWIGGGYKYGVWHKANKPKLAHIFAYECVNGEVPQGLWVLHKCDVSLCVNPQHLYVGTPKQNTADMYNRGRDKSPKGIDHGNNVLTIEAVKRIRKLEGVMTYRKIASLFSVSPQTVYDIIKRRRWKELTDD